MKHLWKTWEGDNYPEDFGIGNSDNYSPCMNLPEGQTTRCPENATEHPANCTFPKCQALNDFRAEWENRRREIKPVMEDDNDY